MRTHLSAISVAALTTLCWLGAFNARAQEGREQKGDAAGVRAAAREYLNAMHRGDRKAAADVWTTDGEYTDAAGQTVKARKLLAQDSAPAGEAPETDIKADIKLPESTLRFVTPEVAIEDGKSNSELTEDGRTVTGKFTAIWVKQDGKWRLDSLRETAIVPPSATERLQPLEWLIGEWVGAVEGGAVLVSSHWCDAGNYIVREFVERGADGAVTTGSQRIGWDPSVQKIKCWTFDSHGGSAEGIWRQDGDRWIVEMTEVMPDGSKAAAMASYTLAGDGRFVWEAMRGKVGDKAVPARRVEFKRAAER